MADGTIGGVLEGQLDVVPLAHTDHCLARLDELGQILNHAVVLDHQHVDFAVSNIQDGSGERPAIFRSKKPRPPMTG
jgi:hypothetical protein